MGWHAHLALVYRRDGARTVAHDRHRGPLRVLRSLHPEGPGVCHHVLVHPPGGVVGGDAIELELALQPLAHALLTTPGATRFYRSAGAVARQCVTAQVADGARLEWLPLETICHRGARAGNRLRFDLAAGAEMIGWDVLALGLPASGETFDQGRFTQQIELPGVWLERGIVDGEDTLLLDSPLGWAGRRVFATLWFAAGRALDPPRREALVDTARAVADAAAAARAAGIGDGAAVLAREDGVGFNHVAALARDSGVTSPDERLVVLRVLTGQVEPARSLLEAVWARWRELAWALPACAPRVWRT